MQTRTEDLAELVLPDVDPTAGHSHGWLTTLRRTVQPLQGARENAHEALLECQIRAEQRRALAQGLLVPAPRSTAE